MGVRFGVNNPTKDGKAREGGNSFERGGMESLQRKGRGRESPIDLTKAFPQKIKSIMQKLLS